MTRSATEATKSAGRQKQPKPRRASRARSKVSKCLAHLQRRRGASIAELGKATGWQPHSIRAALSGLRKQGHHIYRSKDARGITRYAISAP